MDHSIVDPRSLGLRSGRKEHLAVPAVFEITGESGESSRLALVRHELPSGEEKIALHGLRRTRTGWRATKRGVVINKSADDPTQVTVGDSTDVSYSQLYGWRGRKGKFAAGEEGLKLIVSPEGNVLASSTTDTRRVVRMNAEVLNAGTFSGKVAVSPNEPPKPGMPKHAWYRTPAEIEAEAAQQEADREKRQEEIRIAEQKRVHKVFEPNDVPDVTKGEHAPSGYTGPVVSDRTRQFSGKWLGNVEWDGEIQQIYQAETGVRFDLKNPDDVMDRIRTNDGLRQRLGQLFRARIEDRVHLMGDNIRFPDRWKKPNFGGYEGKLMRPTEYAALLAISHLDGTFDPGREHVFAREKEVNEFGWPKVDQHRAAARFALDPYAAR